MELTEEQYQEIERLPPKRCGHVANRFLDRDSLTPGICNGLQALVKLGLVQDGRIRDRTGDSPALTFNAALTMSSRKISS
ncbi:MAG: phosphoribosylformylglycinamidine synthase subunit PurQ [Treponema sp.]|nr:phosphoribosylformylglycinamidine synthase subunit PurQ [Treponema sp.]